MGDIISDSSVTLRELPFEKSVIGKNIRGMRINLYGLRFSLEVDENNTNEHLKTIKIYEDIYEGKQKPRKVYVGCVVVAH